MCSINDSAIADIVFPFLVEFVGASFAGLLGFLIAYWQFNKQNSQRVKRDAVYLRELFERVCFELEDNRNLINERLLPAMQLSKNAFEEHWSYLVTIANALKFSAYDSLLNSGISKDLRIDLSLSN